MLKRHHVDWLRNYASFLSKMGRKQPMTFFREFGTWNFYSFLPARTSRSYSPPVLTIRDIDEAVELFYRDGFVVLSDGLSPDEAAHLGRVVKQKADGIVKADEEGKIDPETKHGNKRYSFGEYGSSAEWEYLAGNERILPILRAIWKGRAFRGVTAGGDFVLPGGTWQPLHNDMSWSSAGNPVPRVITVNYYVSDVRFESGPIRMVPGTARFPVPNSAVIKHEPDWMKRSVITGKPGYAVVRDPRVWHGGTPNTSNEPRYMPNLEYALRDVALSEVGGKPVMDQLHSNKWIAEFANPA